MFEKRYPFVNISPDNPSIQKDANLCVGCGHCLAVCKEEIGVAGRTDSKVDCIHCGQCVAACPERSLLPKSQWQEVKEAAKGKILVVSTAPSVRVALGEAFGGNAGGFVEGQMVAAIKALGADYVLDVAFSADLTILEEGTEFLSRLLKGTGALPQFTSCCPAWVKYVEGFYPDWIPHISSAKSPISMQGALVKTYFAKEMGIDSREILHVAIAPCTAKKFEISREEFSSAGEMLGIPGLRDNDYVLTTAELAEWLQSEQIDFFSLTPQAFDPLMGEGSGAGIIFGNTGGVMEAALRMAYSIVCKKEPPQDLLQYEPVRGMEQVKTASVDLNGKTVRVAVIYGTAVAGELLENGMLNEYDFVEVMTCPGGCISGGGQPRGMVVPVEDRRRKARISSLYQAEKERKSRNSLDNRELTRLYETFLEQPLGERAEELLHTHYTSRR